MTRCIKGDAQNKLWKTIFIEIYGQMDSTIWIEHDAWTEMLRM